MISLEFPILRSIFAAIFLFLGSGFLEGADLHTQVALISEKKSVVPGESFEAGILLRMQPGWHTYYKNPGDSGFPTTMKWKLPEGFTADPIQWPKPAKMTLGSLTSYGYENEVLLLVEIHVPMGIKEGRTFKLEGEVRWLECSLVCIPGKTTVSTALQVSSHSENSPPEVLALFDKYRDQIPKEEGSTPDARRSTSPAPKIQNPIPQPTAYSLQPSFWSALAGAFLGGLILNLMPCVLPVIAIKILGFVKEGREPRARIFGLAYGAGVLVSFWVLALLVLVLQAAGHQVGWGGILFQNPWFLMAMSLVVTAIALNFFGVFEIGLASNVLAGAGELTSKQGLAGAFFNGVLATTLATPCTAPFLGSAVGFAFGQPLLVIFLFFTTIGIGLALPYVILAWNPALLKWLPRPGSWMIRFKQALGFPMLATAVWLLWNLASHDQNAAFWFAGWLVLASFLIWLAGVLFKKFLAVCLVLVGIFAGSWFQLSPLLENAQKTKPLSQRGDWVDWQPWSKRALEEALKTSQPVFVDFTARWCLTCQANKRTSLEVPTVAAKFKELKVIAFMADWTKPNNEITESLRSFGRSGVPLYVLYPSDRTKFPIVLPELLTPQIVINALEQAEGK